MHKQLLYHNSWLMTNINVLVGWHKWTFNEIERENLRTMERVELSLQMQPEQENTTTHFYLLWWKQNIYI